MKGSTMPYTLNELRQRATQLNLYINKRNGYYSIGKYDDYDIDNTNYSCNSKMQVDSFLCGVAYQLYYANKPQRATATVAADNTATVAVADDTRKRYNEQHGNGCS